MQGSGRFGKLDFPLLFNMKDDGEYSQQEFIHGVDLLIRLLGMNLLISPVYYYDIVYVCVGNFRLSLVSILPSFESSIRLLAKLSHSISSIIMLMTGNGESVVDPVIVAAYSTFMESTPSLIDGPLGDLLSQIVDAWCVLLNDPLIVETDSALTDQDSAQVHRIKGALREVCAEVFQNLFMCIVSAVVKETLSFIDEDIDVENDDIDNRLDNNS
jgi:hypothetical protein